MHLFGTVSDTYKAGKRFDFSREVEEELKLYSAILNIPPLKDEIAIYRVERGARTLPDIAFGYRVSKLLEHAVEYLSLYEPCSRLLKALNTSSNRLFTLLAERSETPESAKKYMGYVR